MLNYIKVALFYAGILPFGIIWTYWGTLAVIEGAQSYRWPCVDGTIEVLKATYHEGTGRVPISEGYDVKVRYSFSDKSITYHGHRISTDDMFYGHVFKLGRFGLSAFKKTQAKPLVCYNPKDPAKTALLLRGVSFGSVFRFLVGIGALLFAGFAAFVDLKSR